MPAVKLAEEGFVLDEHHADSLNKMLASAEDYRRVAARRSASRTAASWKAGDRLVQKDLAKTLRLIADEGPDAFYKGEIAELLVAEMKAGGGLITKDDLAKYKANERKPIHGTYRGYDVYGPPPPSSGGTCLVEMLNILENFDLKKHDRYSPRDAAPDGRGDAPRVLPIAPATWATRTSSRFPTHLTTKEYAKKLAGSIDLEEGDAERGLWRRTFR